MTKTLTMHSDTPNVLNVYDKVEVKDTPNTPTQTIDTLHMFIVIMIE